MSSNNSDTASETKASTHAPADVEKQEQPAPSPKAALPTVPDGGVEAWLTVLGAFIVQFASFGYANAYGVYQDFYVREFLTNYTPSEISWIGSIQIFLLLATGPITGRLCDKGYFYHLMITGTLLSALCMFTLSLAKPNQYYQVFLSHGLGLGLAFGIVYLPSVSVIAHHFQKKRPLTMGIIACGASLGAIVHPIMVNQLFHNGVGFHNGVRASAGLVVGLLALSTAIMRTRLPPRKNIPSVPMKSILSEAPTALITVGGFFQAIGIFYPVFYLQLYAVLKGVDTKIAFYSITFLNVGSFFGRLIASFASARLGVFNLTVASTYATSLVIFCLLAVKNLGGVVVFAFAFGFTSGANFSLLAPMGASLAKSFDEVGVRLGIIYSLAGLAGLFGSPILGALLSEKFIWWKPTIFAGIMVSVAATFYTTARGLIAKKKGTQRL